MSKVRDRLKTIIYDEKNKTPNCAMGIVRKTYPNEYVCDVMIISNQAQNMVDVALKVPLPLVGGMSYVMPHAGDKVLVEFLGGDLNYPYVVAIYPSTTSQIASHTEVPFSSTSHFDKLI